MKLAARLTNEKGKVLTLAANEYIDIDITVGNRYLASLTVIETRDGFQVLESNRRPKETGTRTGDKCYRCPKRAQYITHTDKDGNILPHARFTCEEHHYSD